MISGKRKIKVLIIDDSALVRKILVDTLSEDSELEVVGTAPDPFIGRDKIILLEPDVVLLDIELPKMDGLTFLAKLKKYYPIPVIIISSFCKKGSEMALRAKELGAFEVLEKPEALYSIGSMAGLLSNRIKAAVKQRGCYTQENEKMSEGSDKISMKSKNKIIAIGASTGGTEAIKELLIGLPANMPPILIAQHMPQQFTKAFADRLNGLCSLRVKEAENGEQAHPGTVLIAPGDRHMVLKKEGAAYYVWLLDSPPVFHQRPSVEVLFESIAVSTGSNAIGVILTGMGRDGAGGLLQMKNAGAFTIAQDEESCVVFGMPKEAIALGAAQLVAPLGRIPQILIEKMGLTPR